MRGIDITGLFSRVDPYGKYRSANKKSNTRYFTYAFFLLAIPALVLAIIVLIKRRGDRYIGFSLAVTILTTIGGYIALEEASLLKKPRKRAISTISKPHISAATGNAQFLHGICIGCVLFLLGASITTTVRAAQPQPETKPVRAGIKAEEQDRDVDMVAVLAAILFLQFVDYAFVYKGLFRDIRDTRARSEGEEDELRLVVRVTEDTS